MFKLKQMKDYGDEKKQKTKMDMQTFYKNLIKHSNKNGRKVDEIMKDIKRDETIYYKLLVLQYKIYEHFNFDENELYYYNNYLYKYKYIKSLINYKFYEKKDDTTFIELNSNIKINKYIPYTPQFLVGYETLYRLNIKNMGKSVAEITTSPIFFESFYYFQIKEKLYLDTTYDIYYSNMNYFHIPIKKWIEEMKNYENIFHYYNFIYLSQLLANKIEKRYDFMILNLFRSYYKFENSILNNAYHNIPNIYLQLQCLSHLNEHGSALFHIHSFIPETENIYLLLSQMFERIDILGKTDLEMDKYLGGVWLYCQNKGNYKIRYNEKYEKQILKEIDIWENNENKKRYKALSQFYQKIKNYKKYTIYDIRNEQLKASHSWAEKYNFEILPIYDSLLGYSFKNNYNLYFNHYPKGLMTNVKLLKEIKNKRHNLMNFEYSKNVAKRIETIFHELFEKIIYIKSYHFSPYSSNHTNISYHIQQKYKIPFINNSWIQYFDLYYHLPQLFKQKNIVSLHINELPGFSISAIFYYIQLFHKNISWKWNVLDDGVENMDIFGYKKKYSDHFIKIKRGFMSNYINIKYQENLNIVDLLDKHLVFNGIAIIHYQFEKIDDMNDEFFNKVYEFSKLFKTIQLFRSQWATTKNSIFIIGLHKLKKPKKVDKMNLIEHLMDSFIQILNHYQFDLEKQYFIYQNEKKLNDNNKLMIEKSIMKHNREWCKKMKLNRIHEFF